MINNHLYWITRSHPSPSPGYSPAGKGHIDHSLLHLDINGSYHAAIAGHGHAGELANALFAGVADDLFHHQFAEFNLSLSVRRSVGVENSVSKRWVAVRRHMKRHERLSDGI